MGAFCNVTNGIDSSQPHFLFMVDLMLGAVVIFSIYLLIIK